MSDQVKILLADDETVGRQLLEAILIPEGYDLIITEGGAEALEAALKEIPDIILLDVMMPGMDGFEVCRQVRNNKETAHTPIIMITALDDRDSRIKGIDAGADDYISKPFDRVEIVGKIRNKVRLLEHQRVSPPLLDASPKLYKPSEILSTLGSRLLHKILDNKVKYDQATIHLRGEEEFSKHSFVQSSVNRTEHFLFCSNNLQAYEAALANACLVHEWTECVEKTKQESDKDCDCEKVMNILQSNEFEILHELKYFLTSVCNNSQGDKICISGQNQQILVSTGETKDYQLFQLEDKKTLQFSKPAHILLLSPEYFEDARIEKAMLILNNESFNITNPSDLKQLEDCFNNHADQLLAHISF